MQHRRFPSGTCDAFFLISLLFLILCWLTGLLYVLPDWGVHNFPTFKEEVWRGNRFSAATTTDQAVDLESTDAPTELVEFMLLQDMPEEPVEFLEALLLQEMLAESSEFLEVTIVKDIEDISVGMIEPDLALQAPETQISIEGPDEGEEKFGLLSLADLEFAIMDEAESPVIMFSDQVGIGENKHGYTDWLENEVIMGISVLNEIVEEIPRMIEQSIQPRSPAPEPQPQPNPQPFGLSQVNIDLLRDLGPFLSGGYDSSPEQFGYGTRGERVSQNISPNNYESRTPRAGLGAQSVAGFEGDGYRPDTPTLGERRLNSP